MESKTPLKWSFFYSFSIFESFVQHPLLCDSYFVNFKPFLKFRENHWKYNEKNGFIMKVSRQQMFYKKKEIRLCKNFFGINSTIKYWKWKSWDTYFMMNLKKKASQKMWKCDCILRSIINNNNRCRLFYSSCRFWCFV